MTINTDLLKKYGKSNKTEFTDAEFPAQLYAKLLALEDAKDKAANLTLQRDGLTAEKARLEQQLADIGDVPATAPTSLSERYGWIGLKQMKEQTQASRSSTVAALDAVAKELETVQAQIKTIESEVM